VSLFNKGLGCRKTGVIDDVEVIPLQRADAGKNDGVFDFLFWTASLSPSRMSVPDLSRTITTLVKSPAVVCTAGQGISALS